MLSQQLQNIVENLCSEGCIAVNEYIAVLDKGDVLAQTQNLNTGDVALVLAELKSIMAVYDKTDS